MANSTIETLRKNIKKYRLEKGLTQEKLSELTGISTDYLSEIERGKRTSFSSRRTVAHYFGQTSSRI